MKKLLLALSVIGMTWFMGCGGGSEKAKELLQRLLQVVGIPHDIVVNICQDGNENGFCDTFELSAKVQINQGDSLTNILQKVALEEDGSYFLQNYDASKNIIMELQDEANVQYFGGEFAFTYNPETQELSILQAMVDAEQLVPDDVNAIKNIDTVESFYEVLLRDFETNLNTLGMNDFSSPRAVTANIKEMADELLINNIATTLPQELENCNGDQTCVDTRLTQLSQELLIDENETVEILAQETTAHKALLANKSFYEIQDDQSTIEKITFDSNVSLATWEVVEGSTVGEHGATSITIESSKLVSDGEVVLLLRETPTFLLYENEDKSFAKLYFDLEEVQKYVQGVEDNQTTENNETNGTTTSKLYELFSGQKIYYTSNDDKNVYMESWTFNNDVTEITWHTLIGDGLGESDTNTLSNVEGMTFILEPDPEDEEENEPIKATFQETTEDYLLVTFTFSTEDEETGRIYFDKTKAGAYVMELRDGQSTFRDMLIGQTIYYVWYGSSEVDGADEDIDVAVVEEQTLSADGTLIVNGLKNSDNVGTGLWKILGDKEYMGLTQEELADANSYNKYLSGSLEAGCIETSYIDEEEGENPNLTDVDLIFADKETAMNYANSLNDDSVVQCP